MTALSWLRPVLLWGLIPNGVIQAGDPTSITEPSTGVAFPASLSTLRTETEPTLTQTQRLLGLGVRKRTLFRVNVYVVGLYAQAGLETPARDVEASIRAGRVDRSLRLVTTRTIAGERMRSTFEKEMRPRFLRARTRGGFSGTDADWHRFQSFFEMERLEENTVLSFFCDWRGTLRSSIDGAELAPIDSDALCHALFDLYIGNDPISGKLKKSLLSRLEHRRRRGSR